MQILENYYLIAINFFKKANISTQTEISYLEFKEIILDIDEYCLGNLQSASHEMTIKITRHAQ